MFETIKPGPDTVEPTGSEANESKNEEANAQVTPQSDFKSQRAKVAEGVAAPLDTSAEVPTPNTEGLNEALAKVEEKYGKAAEPEVSSNVEVPNTEEEAFEMPPDISETINRASQDVAEPLDTTVKIPTPSTEDESVLSSNEVIPKATPEEIGKAVQEIIDSRKTPEEKLASIKEGLGFLKDKGLKPSLVDNEASFFDDQGNKLELQQVIDTLGEDKAKEAYAGLSQLVDVYFEKPELFTKTEVKETAPIAESKEKDKKDPFPTFRRWSRAAKNRLTKTWRGLTDYSRSPVLNAYKEANDRFVGWQEKVTNNVKERKRILGEKLNTVKENANTTLESFKDLFKWESINTVNERIDLLVNDQDGEVLKLEKSRLEISKKYAEGLRKFVERLNNSKRESELKKENAELKTKLETANAEVANLKTQLESNEAEQAKIEEIDNQPIEWPTPPSLEEGMVEDVSGKEVTPISLNTQTESDTVDQVDSSKSPPAIKLDQSGPEKMAA